MNIEMPEELLKPKNKTEYFKFNEGDNRIRIVSPMLHIEDYFKNNPESTPAQRWLCYLIHYEPVETDGKITYKETLKLAKLPLTIARYVKNLSTDPEWAWEGDIIPFIININAKNAGTKEVDYNPTPSPKKTELSEKMKEELSKVDIVETTKRLKDFRDKAFEEYHSTHQSDTELPTIQEDEDDASDLAF